MESTFLKEKCMPYFQVGRRGQKTSTVSVESHLPPAQNNLYAILGYFGILG